MPTYVTCAYTTCDMTDNDLIVPSVAYVGDSMAEAAGTLVKQIEDNCANIVELNERFWLYGIGPDESAEFRIKEGDPEKKLAAAIQELSDGLTSGKFHTVDCQIYDDGSFYHDVYSIATK